MNIFFSYKNDSTEYLLLENYPPYINISREDSIQFPYNIEVELKSKNNDTLSKYTFSGAKLSTISYTSPINSNKTVSMEFNNYMDLENQTEGINPHDQLNDPYASANILQDHVDEGLKLARRYRIPTPIADFIPEHQGTLKMGYFLHKARE